jgi:hypothetical protein
MPARKCARFVVLAFGVNDKRCAEILFKEIETKLLGARLTGCASQCFSRSVAGDPMPLPLSIKASTQRRIFVELPQPLKADFAQLKQSR